MEVVCWLVLFVIFILLEIITMGLTTIWFGGGSLVALIASLLGANLAVQIILFVVVSVVLLVFTRPYAQRYINNKTVKTNVEELAGKTAKVLEMIDNANSTGVVLLNGLEWMARSVDDEKIISGSLVVVERVEGVKLIVSSKKEEE
jgi:membrane protein implicated in regulation of membrane protease activity